MNIRPLIHLVLTALSSTLASAATLSVTSGTDTFNGDPDTVVLHWSDTGTSTSYKVYISDSSYIYSNDIIANQTNTDCKLSDLEEGHLYYWKVLGLAGSGTVFSSTSTFTTTNINPNKAKTPYPAVGQVGLSADPANPSLTNNILTWASGSSGGSYNVYFGKDLEPDETEFRGNFTGTSFNPGPLEPDTHYYWRVDTVLDPDTHDKPLKGRLWDFTTGTNGAVAYSGTMRTIFADQFENPKTNGDPTVAPCGWTRQNTSAQIRNAGYPTGKCVKLAKTTFIEKQISTEGLSNIHVKFYRSTSGFLTSEFLSVDWSVDGTTWNNLLRTYGTHDYTDGGGLQDKTCAAGANNNPTFRIRFTTNAADTARYAYVDAVQITGTPTHIPLAHTGTIAGKKVMFLGDSLTSKADDFDDRHPDYPHWTSAVQARLGFEILTAVNPLEDKPNTEENEADPNHIANNHGKGGSRAFDTPDTNTDPNSSGGFQRLKYALESDRRGVLHPDFVVINFGMNDHKMHPNGTEVETAAQFEQALRDIITYVRDHNAIPILVTPHDFYLGDPTDLNSYAATFPPGLYTPGTALDRFHLFVDRIRAIGNDTTVGVDVIDLNKAALEYDPEEFTLPGGIHCDKLGHKVYAKTIGDFLNERYGPTP